MRWLAPLVALALVSACTTAEPEDDGFAMQMDVPPPELTACSQFSNCLNGGDEAEICRQATDDLYLCASAPDDEACDGLDARLAACVDSCGDDLPDTSADDRELAEDKWRSCAIEQGPETECAALGDACQPEG